MSSLRRAVLMAALGFVACARGATAFSDLSAPAALSAIDEAERRGSIHEASRRREVLLARCDEGEAKSFAALPEAERAREAGVCAVAYAEQLDHVSPWRRFSLAKRLKGAALALDTNPLSQTERLYFEGRLFSELGDYRRAIIAWASLQRLDPESAAADYELARTYERQRNATPAREAYEKAAPRDARAREWRDTRGSRARQRLLDGWRSGWEPALFFTPMRGLGLFGRIYDERLGDEDRSADVAAWIATRGVFGLRASVQEATWLPPVRLGAAVLGVYGPEDFFGLGPASATADHTRLQGFRADARVTVSQEFLDAFTLTVGWRGMSFAPRTFTRVGGGAPVLPTDTDGALFTGALGELSFDTRDSRINPRSGTYVAIGGFFPVSGFGSARTFTRWHLTAQQYVPFGWRQFLLVQLLAEAVEGNAPFAAYPKLAPVGGVRELRYQDRFAVVLNSEFQRRLFGPVSILAFLSTGTVASSGGSLFRASWKAGVGGGAAIALGPAKLRVELGVFGGELLFRANTGLFF